MPLASSGWLSGRFLFAYKKRIYHLIIFDEIFWSFLLDCSRAPGPGARERRALTRCSVCRAGSDTGAHVPAEAGL